MILKVKQKGITLLETLIVMAVIGISALIAIPFYTDYLSDKRVIAAGERFYHDLAKAREEAVSRGQDVKVVIQTGGSWCYGLTTAVTCSCNTANNCTLGQASSADYEDTALSATGSITEIIFGNSRGVASATGTFTFTAGNGSDIKVELNKMGFGKICSSGLGGYQTC